MFLLSLSVLFSLKLGTGVIMLFDEVYVSLCVVIVQCFAETSLIVSTSDAVTLEFHDLTTTFIQLLLEMKSSPCEGLGENCRVSPAKG